MGFVNGAWMLVLGVLGAASLIIAKKPEAKEMIDKIVPYQGWMGAVSAFWGVWIVISSILNLGWLSVAPIYWITYLAIGVVCIGLGLLLGVGVLKTWIKDATAQEKMDQMVKKLAPFQGTLGLVAIGLGIWGIVSAIIWRV